MEYREGEHQLGASRRNGQIYRSHVDVHRMHGTRKLKILRPSRLYYVGCASASARKRRRIVEAARRNPSRGVYIRRAVASTFPGASMHVERQRPLPVRYLHGTPRTNLTRSGVVRTPTQRARNSSYHSFLSLSLSHSLFFTRRDYKRSVTDPWD